MHSNIRLIPSVVLRHADSTLDCQPLLHCLSFPCCLFAQCLLDFAFCRRVVENNITDRLPGFRDRCRDFPLAFALQSRRAWTADISGLSNVRLLHTPRQLRVVFVGTMFVGEALSWSGIRRGIAGGFSSCLVRTAVLKGGLDTVTQRRDEALAVRIDT